MAASMSASLCAFCRFCCSSASSSIFCEGAAAGALLLLLPPAAAGGTPSGGMGDLKRGARARGVNAVPQTPHSDPHPTFT